jgi:hypothetical protein
MYISWKVRSFGKGDAARIEVKAGVVASIKQEGVRRYY